MAQVQGSYGRYLPDDYYTKNNNNNQSIYDKQLSLAEQIAAEQRRIAQEAATYKKQTLADQLDQQRRSYAQNLAAVNEQTYSQGSKLLSSLANRGLGTSGLLQLGDVQTQMAKGGALSDLAYQQRIGAENIGREQRQVGSSLASALRQAELDKQSSILSAEESEYARSQAERDRQQEIGLSLLEAGASGVLDEDTYSLYAALMGAGSAEEVQEILDSQEFKDATDSSDISDEDIRQGHYNLSFAYGDISKGEMLIKDQQGNIVLDVSNYFDPTNKDNQYDWENINKSVKDLYKTFDNYDNIIVDIKHMGVTSSKPFGFKDINGKMKWYKTWNLASDAYNEMYNSEEE